MKLKILVKLIEKVLGMTDNGDSPRADMYLPDKLLAIGNVFLAGGIACGIFAYVTLVPWAIVCAVLGIIFGAPALLCWRNQTIRVISDTQFIYTTMFGKSYTYSFSDIQGLKKNQDSMTLFVAGKKVHIESMAIISERLASLVNNALSNL